MLPLAISRETERRFILGKQGLYPGRRWQGKAGIEEALRVGCVVQMDPLSVVAHNQDIVLYGRVRNFRPADLQALLYTDRFCFEFGGAVTLHPMEELPYFRAVMARKREEPRRVQFATEHADLVGQVHQAVRERGPLSARDFASTEKVRAGRTKGSFRSDNAANQALYYLWIAGELMTHSRKGHEHIYDLRERLCPANLDYVAPTDAAENFFALKTVQKGGMLSAQEWKQWFSGTIQRSVSAAEAKARLAALLSAGKIAEVRLQAEPNTPRFLLAEDLPLLESLQQGTIPAGWQPLSTSTSEEMIFLAPLEIASARERARSLFDFEYVWEVYKPPDKRRWGYYTLPILYQETLVARTDLKLDRVNNALVVQGFWLEEGVELTALFITALARAFRRFMQFVEAEHLDGTALSPLLLREQIEQGINAL